MTTSFCKLLAGTLQDVSVKWRFKVFFIPASQHYGLKEEWFSISESHLMQKGVLGHLQLQNSYSCKITFWLHTHFLVIKVVIFKMSLTEDCDISQSVVESFNPLSSFMYFSKSLLLIGSSISRISKACWCSLAAY